MGRWVNEYLVGKIGWWVSEWMHHDYVNGWLSIWVDGWMTKSSDEGQMDTCQLP